MSFSYLLPTLEGRSPENAFMNMGEEDEEDYTNFCLFSKKTFRIILFVKYTEMLCLPFISEYTSLMWISGFLSYSTFVSLVKLEKQNTKPKMSIQVEFGNIWSPIEITSKIIECSSSVASCLSRAYCMYLLRIVSVLYFRNVSCCIPELLICTMNL